MRFSGTSNVLPLMSRLLYAMLLLGICLREPAVFSTGHPPTKKGLSIHRCCACLPYNPAVDLKEICSISLRYEKSC